MNKTIWLIGAGAMSVEYAKVLVDLESDFIVIGRSRESAARFKELTGIDVITGGLGAYIKSSFELPDAAIVSVGVGQLADVSKRLIKLGVKELLIEKPGGLNKDQLFDLQATTKKYAAKALIAYNRRFYASVLKAQEIIVSDGGVTSFNFEFTEWSHVIQDIHKAEGVKEKWFLANSTHVTDLAFYLGGIPESMECFSRGALAWHPTSSVFSGAGVCKTGALFSYQANWGAPGRWGVEILTSKHRIILRPLEQVHIQKIGSISLDLVEIDDTLDEQYKPGLFLQTQYFLSGDHDNFCTIDEQCLMMETYYQIANYQ